MRAARLTPAGLAERAVLDERSGELAAALLEPLTATQRNRLLAAMHDVERLLAATAVELSTVDPEHPDVRHCIESYFAELDRRSNSGSARDDSIVVEPDAVRPPRGLMVVAYLRSEPVGCGGVKLHEGGAAEIKRMWVDERARGLGLGRRLLTELEDHARRSGARAARLDTNRNLTEAIAMYRSAGYVEVEPFNDEPFAHHWFEKPLGRVAPPPRPG